MFRNIVILIGGIGCCVSRGGAQAGSVNLSGTAAEVERAVWMYSQGVMTPLANDGRHLVPRDSVNAMLLAFTKHWLEHLPAASRHGIQLEALGALYSLMQWDTAAAHAFDTRLHTGRLSPLARAYALLKATEGLAKFSSAGIQDTVQSYLAQLDTAKDDALEWTFRAHASRGYAAYNAGRAAEALSEFTKALNTVARMPFLSRYRVVDDEYNTFVNYAVLMAGQPRGRARIDSTARAVIALLTPPASFTAADSNKYRGISWWREVMHQQIVQTSHLGDRAPPIIAMAWLNLPATHGVTPMRTGQLPNAGILSLNDGTIRLFEFGDIACSACMNALPVMDRLSQNLASFDSIPSSNNPKAEVWYVTNTSGFWGIQSCTPDEEVRHLRSYYVDTRHFRLPIAIWAGPKDATIDGGLIARESQTKTQYGITTTPTFILVDGQGMIRHIEIGFSSAGMLRIEDRLRYLRAEAAQSQPSQKRAGTL